MSMRMRYKIMIKFCNEIPLIDLRCYGNCFELLASLTDGLDYGASLRTRTERVGRVLHITTYKDGDKKGVAFSKRVWAGLLFMLANLTFYNIAIIIAHRTMIEQLIDLTGKYPSVFC